MKTIQQWDEIQQRGDEGEMSRFVGELLYDKAYADDTIQHLKDKVAEKRGRIRELEHRIGVLEDELRKAYTMINAPAEAKENMASFHVKHVNADGEEIQPRSMPEYAVRVYTGEELAQHYMRTGQC